MTLRCNRSAIVDTTSGNLAAPRLSTGIPGLDEILQGGLIQNRAYLVRGGPGTGKTTLGTHFLAAGVLAGEKTLLITLSEPGSKSLSAANTLVLISRMLRFWISAPMPSFLPRLSPMTFFLLQR